MVQNGYVNKELKKVIINIKETVYYLCLKVLVRTKFLAYSVQKRLNFNVYDI